MQDNFSLDSGPSTTQPLPDYRSTPNQLLVFVECSGQDSLLSRDFIPVAIHLNFLFPCF